MALIFEKYCPNTQQRIEITNCEHRCLLKMTRSFIIDVWLHASIWLDIVYVTVFIINGLPDRPQVYGCCSVDQASSHREYRELLGLILF